MKFKSAILTLLCLGLTTPLFADEKHTSAPPFEATLPWLTELDTALAQSQKTGKPILAEFR